MNSIVTIALAGWPVLVVILYATMPPRRAMLTAVVGGLLFLPNAGFTLSGLPDYDKSVAIALSAYVGACLLDTKSIINVRPRWFDAPMLIWVLSPLPSSVSNGLGVYDGLSGVLTHLIVYGMPYVLGRAYCSTAAGLLDLARAIVIGGLVYVPLCLWEIRMSPQLHKQLYGFAQIKSHMTKRLGGYRPTVFLTHGIQLGSFMAVATLAAGWMWWTKALRQILSIPIGWCTAGLASTLLLCNALNGYFMLALGTAVLSIARATGTRLALWAMVLIPMAYVGVRVTGDWTANRVVDAVAVIDNERADSLRSRIVQETLLISKAWARPAFGWGGYGRNRAEFTAEAREEGAMGKRSITDSWWIIEFGQRGLLGLFAWGSVLLLPLCVALRRQSWPKDLEYELALMLGVVITLFAYDCLFNAFPAAIYFVLAGGVTAFAANATPQRVLATTRLYTLAATSRASVH